MFGRIRRIRRIFPLRFHTEYVYEHSLRVLPEIDVPDFITIRTLSLSEISLLRNVWPVNLEQASKRFDRGDKCFCAFLNDELVSYHWVQYSGKHYLQQAGRYYETSADDAWIFHVRVAEKARGRNINSMVYLRILQDAKARGKKRVHVYTGSDNLANQKGLQRCGFKMSEKLVSLQSGKKFLLLFKRLVP